MTEKPGYEPDPLQDDSELFTGRIHGAGEEPQINAFARIFKIFTSPGEVFRDIARKPTWVVILVLTTLVGAGAQFATLPHMDLEATIRTSMEKSNPDMDDEQIAKIAERASKFAWVGSAASVVFIPIVMVVMGGIYLLGLRLTGSETDFAHVFSTVLHAYWPAGVAKGVLFLALLQRVGKMPAEALQTLVKSNVGAFLPADAPHWQVALGSFFDIFNLWTIVLLVLGLSIVGGVSRKKAGVTVGILWVLYLGFKVGLAFLKG